MSKLYIALSALLLASTPAIAASPVEERAKADASHAQYDKLFDYYMEVCGVTQYRPRKGEAGGEYGHTVIYLKGACRDESASYPKLKMCAPDAAEKGASISMDSDYANVRWTTVSTRSFMMYGDLPADSALTEKEHEAAIQSAIDQKIFRGVKLLPYHREKMKRGESYEHYVARWSIGTNFAVNFARASYCTRVPLISNKGPKDAMVKSLVDYYNAQNAKAQRAGFAYNGITDNCTHLAHNGLASVGYWPAKETGWEEPAGFGWLAAHTKENVSVPFNTMLDSLTKGAGASDTFNPARLADADAERKGFYKYGWIGSQPGVVMEVIPMHNFKNEKYLPGAAPFLLDPNSALMAKMNFSAKNDEMERFERTIKESRFTDLKTNLKYWQKKYANDARVGFPRDTRFPDLSPALNAYLRAQQSDLAERSRLLQETEATAETTTAAPATSAR